MWPSLFTIFMLHFLALSSILCCRENTKHIMEEVMAVTEPTYNNEIKMPLLLTFKPPQKWTARILRWWSTRCTAWNFVLGFPTLNTTPVTSTSCHRGLNSPRMVRHRGVTERVCSDRHSNGPLEQRSHLVCRVDLNCLLPHLREKLFNGKSHGKQSELCWIYTYKEKHWLKEDNCIYDLNVTLSQSV